MGKKIFAALSTVVMTLAMLAAPFAEAAEVTRESYKEAVEPICKTNTEANEKILKGVRQKVKAGKLKAAGTQFEKAGKALHKAIVQLKAVPQPTADEAKLAKWLKYVGEEEKLFLQRRQAAQGRQQDRRPGDRDPPQPQRQPGQQPGPRLRIQVLPLRTLEVHLIQA